MRAQEPHFKLSILAFGLAILITCLSVLPIYFLRTPTSVSTTTTSEPSYIQLTSGNWNDLYPVYSPNGQTIAFASDRYGQVSLYLMNSAGSKVTALFSSPSVANISSPEFDSTGSTIAFIATWTNQSSSLLVITSQGKGLHDLTLNDGIVGSFSWGPNGQTIAYDEYQGGMWKIWLVNISEGYPSVLLPPSGSSSTVYNYRYPSWGSNGTWLVFSSDRSQQNQYNIWSYNLNTESLNELTSEQGNDTRPAVSPNGAYVSYVSYYKDNGEWTLWVVNSNGTNAHLATSEYQDQNPGISWIPAVSPDSYPQWNANSNGVMFFTNPESEGPNQTSANVFVYYIGVNVSVYVHIGPTRQMIGNALVAMIYGPRDIDPSWGSSGLSILFCQSDSSGGYSHVWVRTFASALPMPSYSSSSS
jgi:Tol biopolymer transport system component